MQKGLALVYVLVGLVGLVVVAGGAYYFGKFPVKFPSKAVKVCTEEAKQCPDGSYVSRTGPNCEFALCPSAKPQPTDETASWKTYTNTKHGYSIKYPTKWSVPSEDQTEALFAPPQSEGAPLGLSVKQDTPLNIINKRDNELISAGYKTKIEDYKTQYVSGKKIIFEKDDNIGYDFFAEKDGYTYWFEGASGKFKAEADNMLYNFKFLPASPFGDQAKSSCGPCPQFMPPAPNSCLDGTIIPGGKNECGCQLPPRCQR